MSKTWFVKLLAVGATVFLFSATGSARNEHMKIYEADSFAKEENHRKCSICHTDEDDKAKINAFGKAFAKLEYTITPELRHKFPEYFMPEAGGQLEGDKNAKPEKDTKPEKDAKPAKQEKPPANDFLKSLIGANYRIVSVAHALVSGRKQSGSAKVQGDLMASLDDPATPEGKPEDKEVEGEIIVERDGKRYAVNIREKTVREIVGAAPSPLKAEPAAQPSTTPQEKKIAAAAPTGSKADDKKKSKVYRQSDIRLINLPTPIPIPKGSLWNDYTHRWPNGDTTSASTLYGLDTRAIPSFGFLYGVTDRIHVGAYRSPGDLGRPIQLFAGLGVLNEQKGHPFSMMARVGIEGRDNFKRNFAPSIELSFARSITKYAQIYASPTVTFGDRPYNVESTQNAPGVTAYAMGLGGTVLIRPSVALLFEANYRLNEEARYIDADTGNGIRRPVVGFGVQKIGASKRHVYTLSFTNGGGTTMSQRSMTRGLQGQDDTLRGLTVGFNLTRRIF
jgi:hypothetical protein